MAEPVVDSPNVAQDHNLTQTSPKKAVSLRDAMNRSFEEQGFKTGLTSKRESHERLPGEGAGGDHFPGQDLTVGPKTKAREQAAAQGGSEGTEPTAEPATAEPPTRKEQPKRNVGGFTDTKPAGLETPPEPEVTEPATTTVVTTATLPTDTDDIDSIRLHPNASKETQEGWDALKGKTKEYKAKFVEAQKRATALEEAMKSGQTMTPELKAQIDRADEVLRTLDLKSHPQFYTQYQQPIDQGLGKLFDTISEAWDTDPNKANWFPKWQEEVKRLGVDGIDKEWWKQNVLDKIEDPDLKHEASQQIRSLYRLKGTRDSQMSDLSDKQKYDAWVKTNWESNWKGYVGELSKNADDVAKELSKKYPWAVPIPITEGMDPTAKQRAEAHNAEYGKLVSGFTEAVQMINGYNPDGSLKAAEIKPKDHARVAATYALAKRLESDIESITVERDTLLQRVDKMQKELDGYKRVRSANGKPAATHAAPPRKAPAKLGGGPGGARAALDAMAEEYAGGSN